MNGSWNETIDFEYFDGRLFLSRRNGKKCTGMGGGERGFYCLRKRINDDE